MFTMQLRGRTVQVSMQDGEVLLLDERRRPLRWHLSESEAEDVMQEAPSHGDAELWSDADPDED
jgi:hypothetical protein